jgi:hypothetical protein
VGRDTLTNDVLLSFAIEDVLVGKGLVWIATDKSARTLLNYIPGSRVQETIFFSPGSDIDRPYGWNLLKDTLPDERSEVSEAITNAFGSIYKNFWGPQSAFLLRTAVHANLDLGNTTLLGCLAMIGNKSYREMVRGRIKDPVVLSWWEEFERWPEHQQRAAVAPLQNKLGALLTSLPVRNIIGQVRNKLEVGQALEGKILLVELRPRYLGGLEMVRLFGSLLLYELMRAGYKRDSRSASDCFVYINSCHTFSPEVLEELIGVSDSPFSVALATSHLDRLDQTQVQGGMVRSNEFCPDTAS